MQVHQLSPSPIGLPSPTLTNPDMILPDSSSSTESSLPTPKHHERLPSPSRTGNGYHQFGALHDENSRVKGPMCSPFRHGVLRRHDGSARRRSSSEKGDNRISFEQNRLSYQQGGELLFASSPTMQENPSDFGQRIYTDSTQGDYENGEGTYSTPAILEEDENDPYSHAAMTRRAEEILANAKRRLTNMEGNLNRARSTLHTRPSSSMSSFRNRSPEPVSLYAIPGKGRSPSTFSPSKHRQGNLPSSDEANKGHLRVFSETSVPSSLQTVQPNGQTTGGDPGTSNGLGIHAANAATPERNSEPSRSWFWNGLTRNTSLNHTNRHANGLQALNEDGPAPASFGQRATREDTIEEERSVDLQSPTVATFNAQNPPTMGLTRARSTTQMNDLREQMQDLKGKISTLKQRAREDNLRRRSLQSLRTPSPFTAAEQWYAGGPPSEDLPTASGSELSKATETTDILDVHSRSPPDDSNHASPALGPSNNASNGDAELRKEDALAAHQEDNMKPEEPPENQLEALNGFPSPEKRPVLTDEPAESGSNADSDVSEFKEGNLPADSEAKEDSLYGDHDFHETSTSPIVERHEDRPDAFDYEHFILHSAMGSYSGVGMRGSSSMRKRANSQSSESSVETTKPRNSLGDAPQGEERLSNGFHARQGSVDTVSSVNTFATADEGIDSDELQDQRTPRKPTAEAWQANTARGHKINRSDESNPESLQSNGYGPRSRAKHIATAQKGYANGTTPKSPPIERGLPPPPPDLLTVLSATTPWQEGAPPTKLDLGDRDKELIERLVKSLAKVCSQVQTLGPEGSKYEARVFRRKLDAARRVLDGEMNGEAF